MGYEHAGEHASGINRVGAGEVDFASLHNRISTGAYLRIIPTQYAQLDRRQPTLVLRCLVVNAAITNLGVVDVDRRRKQN